MNMQLISKAKDLWCEHRKLSIIIATALAVVVICVVISIIIAAEGIWFSDNNPQNLSPLNADGNFNYEDDEATRVLPSYDCGKAEYSFGDNAKLLCDIQINTIDGSKPFDDAKSQGDKFPSSIQNIKNTAGIILNPGNGAKLEIHKTVKFNLFQYVFTNKDINNNGSYFETNKWQLLTDTWAKPVEDLTLNITKSAADGSVTSQLGSLLNGNQVGATFAAMVIMNNASDTQEATPPLLLIGVVEEVYDRVMPEEGVNVNSLPKPSIDIPSNAPSVLFDSQNRPLKISIDSGFELSGNYFIKTLLKGTGQELRITDTAIVKYTMWDKNGKELDSTFERDRTEAIELSNTVSGIAGGLNGQRVGSRLLIMIPSKYADFSNDEQKDDSSSPNDTTSFGGFEGAGEEEDKVTTNSDLYYYVEIIGVE